MKFKHWSLAIDECKIGLSDSDIETLRQRHQEISTLVSETDKFLMFHTGGAFCCQLFSVILLLYDIIFAYATDDVVVIMMRVSYLVGLSCGLSVTTTGGIMVNHYVSIHMLNIILLCA